MCTPIPTGSEMVQVMKRNSLGGEVLSALQQGFRKLEELAKLNKMLKVSIATGSAHCWPLGGASNILQEINMKALSLLEENLHTKSGGELRNFSIAYFSLIGMAAVALEHVSQRNTAPNFQGKHAHTHTPHPPSGRLWGLQGKTEGINISRSYFAWKYCVWSFHLLSWFPLTFQDCFWVKKVNLYFLSYAGLWGAWCNWHISSSPQFLNTEKYIASYALLGSKQPMLFVMQQGASTS